MSSRTARALAAWGTGAALTRLAYRALAARPPGGGARWDRINHRGEPVTLLEGPAVATGIVAAALTAPGLPGRLRAAVALAAAGAGGFGVLDDLGETGTSKGLRGHLGALRRGELTTGGAKLLGIGVTGLVAAALARPDSGPRSRSRSRSRVGAGVDVLASGALIAGAANLINLFDLRPGRALKVSLLHAPGVLGAGPASAVVGLTTGAATALLSEDLGERAMLGDAGANALGAALGVAVVAGAPRPARWAVLAGILGLTLASEKVSFTKVIATTPGLREFDALGRRPAAR